MTNKGTGWTGRRRLYLMRHGHVDYFAPGLTDFRSVPLTEDGQEQADAAGRALSETRFDAAFSSGLPRTVQTLDRVLTLNTASDASPTAVPAFEELRGGTVVVPTREELAARLAFSFDAATEEGAAFLPGGEAFADAYSRVVSGLEALVATRQWQQAVLVAHEGVNRLLLSHACGAGLAGLGAFEQDLACINVLDLDVVPAPKGGLTFARIVIKALNLTAYDPVKRHLTRTSLEHLFEIDFGASRPAGPPPEIPPSMSA